MADWRHENINRRSAATRATDGIETSLAASRPALLLPGRAAQPRSPAAETYLARLRGAHAPVSSKRGLGCLVQGAVDLGGQREPSTGTVQHDVHGRYLGDAQGRLVPGRPKECA